jgi:endonuclease/exonuclease/phosphatase family metal-dependent hydrolase
MRVMTYNIRFADAPGDTPWARRRPRVAEVLHDWQPDVLGVQEALAGQMADVAEDLGDAYGSFGRGREADGTGEFCPIHYRRKSLDLLDHGEFWLSDTPAEPGSRTWGNGIPRLCTWGRFKIISGGEVGVFNTHFASRHPKSRTKSATLIRQRAEAMAPRVIVMGDFNAAQGSPPHEILTADNLLRDAFDLADEKTPDLDTFGGFANRPRDERGVRIDWILVGYAFGVTRCAIDNRATDGEHPSDHRPVIADLTTKGTP